jgi:hypothetical protein
MTNRSCQFHFCVSPHGVGFGQAETEGSDEKIYVRVVKQLVFFKVQVIGVFPLLAIMQACWAYLRSQREVSVNSLQL